MSKICKKFIVYGLVQGVGYRYFAYKSAVKYSITGYAKNLFDGTVEIVAQGEENNLKLFLEELKIGPSRARVTNITQEDCKFDDEYLEFSVY